MALLGYSGLIPSIGQKLLRGEEKRFDREAELTATVGTPQTLKQTFLPRHHLLY